VTEITPGEPGWVCSDDVPNKTTEIGFLCTIAQREGGGLVIPHRGRVPEQDDLTNGGAQLSIAKNVMLDSFDESVVVCEP